MDSKKSRKVGIIVGIVKGTVSALLLVGLVFLSAGTLYWPEFWILLASYLVIMTGLVLWLKRRDPELLKERSSRKSKKEAKWWDKVIIACYSLLILVLLLVAGMDAVRFQWSRVPLVVLLLGYLGFIPALLIVVWAMRENTYLSEMVRIQEERGHRVCSSGPYRYVRHPMYVGVIIFILCLPLTLGSLVALIPAGLIVVLFILRTALEDKTLQNELPGYREYMQSVRFRLIPGIW